LEQLEAAFAKLGAALQGMREQLKLPAQLPVSSHVRTVLVTDA